MSGGRQLFLGDAVVADDHEDVTGWLANRTGRTAGHRFDPLLNRARVRNRGLHVERINAQLEIMLGISNRRLQSLAEKQGRLLRRERKNVQCLGDRQTLN